jgi:hypothetical protein
MSQHEVVDQLEPVGQTPPPSRVTVPAVAGPAVAVLVEELLPGEGSTVEEDTVAVFEMIVPFGVVNGTLATRVNVADAPLASVAMVQVTVAPVVQINVGPEFWFKDTKVKPAGSVSVRLTLEALDGPALLTEIE